MAKLERWNGGAWGTNASLDRPEPTFRKHPQCAEVRPWEALFRLLRARSGLQPLRSAMYCREKIQEIEADEAEGVIAAHDSVHEDEHLCHVVVRP